MMARIPFLLIALALWLSAEPSSAVSSSPPPNIALTLAVDLGYEDSIRCDDTDNVSTSKAEDFVRKHVAFPRDNGSVHHPDSAKLGHSPSGDRRGYKTDAWDSGTSVPFIVRWPGKIPAASSRDKLICHVNLLATFAVLTGHELPDWQAEDGSTISTTTLTKPPICGRDPLRSSTVCDCGSAPLGNRAAPSNCPKHTQ
jgi:hypothetical protein